MLVKQPKQIEVAISALKKIGAMKWNSRDNADSLMDKLKKTKIAVTPLDVAAKQASNTSESTQKSL